MPQAKKQVKTDDVEFEGPPQVVLVRKRKPTEWNTLLAEKAGEHWRKLRITVQVRDKLLAGKPKQLDAANAMLKARGLEDAIEAVNVEDPNALAEAADKAVDEGICEFHRREGKPGLWLCSNNLKAMFKENWSVLGYRVMHRGSRGALAEGVFVVSTDPADRDWIYLGDKPDGIEQAVAHTNGPMGPQSSIKCNEFIIRPKITFEVWIAHAIAAKLPDIAFADVLVHAGEHGMGASRSQGYGKFDVLSVEEFDERADDAKAVNN